MLPFLHYQQRSTTCAVAAVRTVLHGQFGVRLSESALVALGTVSEEPLIQTGSMTHHLRRMVHGASRGYNRHEPWRLPVRANGTWEDLRTWLAQGRYPIVQVRDGEPECAHAVVVLEIQGNAACVFDPAGPTESHEQPHWHSRKQFEQWWYVAHLQQHWWAGISGGRLSHVPGSLVTT